VPQVVKAEPANEQFDSGQEMVKAMRQVVSSPKVEYQRFDGDPLKYVTFMHRFETYLEKDNPDESRRLQLLIQHCTGKAREAIEVMQICLTMVTEWQNKPYVRTLENRM